VNLVTEHLFQKYTNVSDFAEADLRELEIDIHSTGFYKNKAKNIKACCQMLVSDYKSKLPKTLDELVTLAGVGRKTANVVLGNAFSIASGVVVDTHVTRISNRLGLVKGKNAVIIERVLNKIIKQEYWIDYPLWTIHHGRKVCKARKPLCRECFISEYCDYVKSNEECM
jgi:endonuclease-3